MENYNKRREALLYHAKPTPGKIQVVPTKKYATQRDLALAYSPGVAEPCLEIEKDVNNVYKYTAKVKPDGSFTLDSLVFYGIQKFTYKYYTTANKELASSLKLTENKNNSLLDSLLTYGYGFILKDKIVIIASNKFDNFIIFLFATNI